MLSYFVIHLQKPAESIKIMLIYSTLTEPHTLFCSLQLSWTISWEFST